MEDRTGYLRALRMKAADWCYTRRLNGVNHTNADGSSRQKYVKQCMALDPVKLVSSPTKKDPNSIGVEDAKGHPLGYLDARASQEIRQALAQGGRFEALVVTRWLDPSGFYGLVIAVFKLKPEYTSLKQAADGGGPKPWSAKVLGGRMLSRGAAGSPGAADVSGSRAE